MHLLDLPFLALQCVLENMAVAVGFVQSSKASHGIQIFR